MKLFAASLILGAGAITALVASAAMRTARSYELAVRVPQFAERFVSTSLVARAALTLCMVLPPLVSLLWVRLLLPPVSLGPAGRPSSVRYVQHCGRALLL